MPEVPKADRNSSVLLHCEPMKGAGRSKTSRSAGSPALGWHLASVKLQSGGTTQLLVLLGHCSQLFAFWFQG
jgi:hypothetical protein